MLDIVHNCRIEQIEYLFTNNLKRFDIIGIRGVGLSFFTLAVLISSSEKRFYVQNIISSPINNAPLKLLCPIYSCSSQSPLSYTFNRLMTDEIFGFITFTEMNMITIWHIIEPSKYIFAKKPLIFQSFCIDLNDKTKIIQCYADSNKLIILNKSGKMRIYCTFNGDLIKTLKAWKHCPNGFIQFQVIDWNIALLQKGTILLWDLDNSLLSNRKISNYHHHNGIFINLHLEFVIICSSFFIYFLL